MVKNVILSVGQAVEQLMHRSPEFLLRGLLVTGWYNALLQYKDPSLMAVYERNELLTEAPPDWVPTRPTFLNTTYQTYSDNIALVSKQR